MEFNGTNVIGASAGGDVNLADFNPDFLAGLTVTKSPTASDAEGAIGGIVNLITKKPLDLPNGYLSGRAQGIYYDQAEDVGYRASAVAAGRFFDDTLGVLLGVSVYNYNRRSFRFDTDGWTLTNGIDTTGDGVADPGRWRPNRMVLNDNPVHQEREVYNASLQWRPTDTFELNIDAAHTHSYRDLSAQRLQVILTDQVTGATADATGTVVTGTYTNPTLRPTIYSEITEADQSILSAHARWTPDRFTIDLRAAHSEGTLENPIAVPLTRPRPGTTTTIRTDFTTGADVPTFVLSQNYDQSDPASYVLISNFETRDNNDNAGDELRLDVRYDTGWSPFTDLRGGGRFESLTVDSVRRSQNPTAAAILAANPGVDTNGNGLIDQNELVGFTYSPTRFLNDASGVYPSTWFGGRVDFPTERAGLGLGEPPVEAASVRGVDQDTWAGYVQADFEFDLFQVPVRGNIGTRYISTERTARGNVVAGATVTPIAITAEFTDWLPSMNVRADLTEDLVARFSAGKVIARPALNQVAPGTVLNVVTFTASRGNPLLEPFRATQYDAALEWYFAPASILSLTGFYKEISSFTVNSVTRETFNGQSFQVSQPTNGNDGKIQGFEIGYQQAFHGILDGFGVGLSYTYSDSETPLINSLTGASDPLPGLSENSYNATAYLERDWGNLRLTYNWRDEYLDLVQTAALGGNQYEFARGQLDASAQFNLTENVRLLVEAVNILKDAQRFYTGVESRLKSYNVDDRRIYFGLSATF